VFAEAFDDGSDGERPTARGTETPVEWETAVEEVAVGIDGTRDRDDDRDPCEPPGEVGFKFEFACV
jgi:hypothetical protein